MENLSLEELHTLEEWYLAVMYDGQVKSIDRVIYEKIIQAIADKEFEEKTRPLNF